MGLKGRKISIPLNRLMPEKYVAAETRRLLEVERRVIGNVMDRPLREEKEGKQKVLSYYERTSCNLKNR